MWWIVGLGGLAILIFLFTKFRAASHRMQLIQVGQNHLATSFRSLDLFEQEINERVWRDPYLLGYAQGSLSLMVRFFGGKLSVMQKGMVTIDVLKGLVGERYVEVCEAISRFHEIRDPEFLRGMGHGGDVAILLSNRPGPALLADPDVQAALRQAPEFSQVAARIFGPSDAGPFAAAGAILGQTYMERHKHDVGY